MIEKAHRPTAAVTFDILEVSVGAFAVNERHEIVAWNEAAAQIFGWNARQTIGQHCTDVMDARLASFCQHCALRDVCDVAQAQATHTKSYPIRLAQHGVREKVALTSFLAHSSAGDLQVVHLVHATGQTEAIEEPSKHTPVPPPAVARHSPVTPYNSAHHSFSDPDLAPVVQPRLTSRELEVLHLLAEGCATGDITESLHITHSTARNHIANIFAKLGAANRLQAVVLATELGVL